MNLRDIERLVDAELVQSTGLNTVTTKDFRGQNLENAILTGADLRGADLSGADLRGASLKGADLEGADLDDAHLETATLNRSQMQDVSLIGAQLAGSNLTRAVLARARLEHADLEGAALVHANLYNADLRAANLTHSNFRNADLTGSSFANATLDGSDFYQTSLAGADFRQTSLASAHLMPDPKSQDAIAAYISSEWLPGAENEEQLRLILRMWEGARQGLHWAPVNFPSGRRIYKMWSHRVWGLLGMFVRQQDGSWVRVPPSAFLDDLRERKATAEYLGVDPATRFNRAFWQEPVALQYDTADPHAVLTSGRGLKAVQLERGKGPRVVTLTRYQADVLNSSPVTVDTSTMREDGNTPFITTDPEFLERSALTEVARQLGLTRDREQPDVYYLHGDVPAKYLL